MGSSASVFISSSKGGVNSHFVVQVISASDVPKADLTSDSDPYVKLYFLQNPGRSYKDHKKLTRPLKTLYRNDNVRPIWNSYLNLRLQPPDNAYLRCEVWDKDGAKKDDIIGHVDIPVIELKDNLPRTYKLQFHAFGSPSKNPEFSVTLRRTFVDSVPPKHKTFFILRHGESRWNEAQKNKDVGGLIDHDHPLTRAGIEQARSLNERWKRCVLNDGSDSCLTSSSLSGSSPLQSQQRRQVSVLSTLDNAESSELYFQKCFLQATKAYCSPLTRAVQTALAGLHGHPCLLTSGLTLYSVIREVKNIGGMDTVGRYVGSQIKENVREELVNELGVEEAEKLLGVDVHEGDADMPWWNAQLSFESEKDIQLRVNDFLNFVRYNGDDIPIFVGHSLFFKAFYKTRVSRLMASRQPEIAQKLRNFKLDNATVLGVTVFFSDDGSDPFIENAAILFGGGFHESGRRHSRIDED